MKLAMSLAALVALCSAQYPSKHEVTSLPGVPKMPSKMYSGYINAGVPPSGKGTMYFHYWMVESQGNPATDPVVMWYNGGPGASSLFGLLQEFGPLLLNVDSYDAQWKQTGVPTPQVNPWAWSRNATLICIDSPPPIGFSFCTEEGPSGGGTSCGPWTDKTVFAANHKAHQTLFNDIIPEFKPNPFFMFGESYAGVYVPGFVNALLDDPIPGLNFRGFGIGDGWTGCVPKDGQPANWCVNLDNVGFFKYPNVNPGPWYDIEFFHGHDQFSQDLYRNIRKTCTDEELHTPNLSPACQKLIDQMSDEIGGFYVYNLYNNCPQNLLKHGMNNALKTRKSVLRAVAYPGAQGMTTGVCPGNAMPDWLLLNDTLNALGAPLDTNFLNLDNGHGFNYTSDQTDIRFVYQKAIDKGLKVLVYEGDSDACGLQTAPIEDKFVPYFNNIGLKATSSWRPWTTDGQQQMAGYVIEWNNGVARFVSIRGAGHLVPHNQPEVALFLLENFICEATKGNCPLPKYAPPMRA
eukprot:TRINITY_DN2173_c0_g1_i3.p1 TRINITY_DN2173_c0_g1~~TRINITY_DN2173_c0_g1_i3.p1  ORF type:complete len:518 (+),score=176.46 TRINITY_DN2173_c0_g1_i3:958-2511(+)